MTEFYNTLNSLQKRAYCLLLIRQDHEPTLREINRFILFGRA